MAQRLRLNTIGEVKTELGRVYRQAKRGELQVDAASKLAHMLSILARIIQGQELEDRIAQLERQGEKP